MLDRYFWINLRHLPYPCYCTSLFLLGLPIKIKDKRLEKPDKKKELNTFAKNSISMLRTTNCGALTLAQLGEEVTLAGWVQKTRDKGFVLWVDLRDRYGLTQIIFDEERTIKGGHGESPKLGKRICHSSTGNCH